MSLASCEEINTKVKEMAEHQLNLLNKKVKYSKNQMMKEQRSQSVGSLPGNLKSRILKSLAKGNDLVPSGPSEQDSDHFDEKNYLNKIRELPEEYEKPDKSKKLSKEQT